MKYVSLKFEFGMIVSQLAKLKRIQNKQPKLMYLKGNLVQRLDLREAGIVFKAEYLSLNNTLAFS